jgi:hypothetical protein
MTVASDVEPTISTRHASFPRQRTLFDRKCMKVKLDHLHKSPFSYDPTILNFLKEDALNASSLKAIRTKERKTRQTGESERKR